MRISHFFIDRPIFASVISIVILILGAVSFTRLPVAQYPEIAPPTINVTGQYPGASAETVAETVVAPIEQQINGVEGMIYVSSNSTSSRKSVSYSASEISGESSTWYCKLWCSMSRRRRSIRR